MKTEDQDSIELIITDQDVSNYKRFDHYLADKIPDYSRTFLKDLFKKEMVEISDQSPVGGFKLELKKMPPTGSIISVQIPPPLPSTAQPENIPLEIVWEDEHMVFINKPAGMVTHPAPGNYTGTLVNAILHHCPDLQGVGDQKRPGIVHRLDKGTSGVMVVAKNQKAHEKLVLLFSSHNIERRYHALVMGAKLPAGGTLQSSLGRHPQNRLKMAANVRGKNAITHYKVLEYFKNCSLVELKLETGRTHQIRVHLSQLLKAPIACDPLYGNPSEHLRRLAPALRPLLKDYPHPLLHARVLGLVHPITGEKLRFEIEPPQIFQDVVKITREESVHG